uniref:SUZ domain-containing protein n=2 Tax=Opuntia streptacantha TaxID=393608 RepID=A0A7C8ZVB5_OPUST
MDSIKTSNNGGSVERENEEDDNNNNNNYASMVDPFLVEALQNPRHRLTILRMELDVQKFLQNPELLQFEFQHFPTSYLRLAAHRVAQHYGLQTVVLDNLIDGPGTKIVVRKTAETKFPSVRLSDVPAKQPENSKHEQVKIAIRCRPNRTSGDASDMGTKNSTVRSVEERKEEYDRARARIFSSPGSPSTEEMMSPVVVNGKGPCPSQDENVACRDFITDPEKLSSVRDIGTSSRVAIFKDREKDRADPDYDRSYERYVKSVPTGQWLLMPFNIPKFQPPFLQYEVPFPQMGQIPRAQAPLNYGPSSNPSISHYCMMGSNHASRDAIYMQWPSPAMMYAHPYGQFHNSLFQAPFSQQPLSFEYCQNH